MKYLWGSQVFRQKDCYAKSEPCYFTKGWKNKKRLGYIVPLAGSCGALDTGHILMSVFDHKHLVLEASAVCVIFRDRDGKFKIQILLNSGEDVAIKVFADHSVLNEG